LVEFYVMQFTLMMTYDEVGDRFV